MVYESQCRCGVHPELKLPSSPRNPQHEVSNALRSIVLRRSRHLCLPNSKALYFAFRHYIENLDTGLPSII